MNKMQELKNALGKGVYSLAALAAETGLDKKLVSVYLTVLSKRGECVRSGARRSYLYTSASVGGGEAAGTFPAESDAVGGEGGDGGRDPEAASSGGGEAGEVAPEDAA